MAPSYDRLARLRAPSYDRLARLRALSYDRLAASLEFRYALRSYDVSSAKLKERGDHIITLWLAKAHKFSEANS